MQDKEQVDGPSRHETGTWMRRHGQKERKQQASGARETKPERDVYGGGVGPNGVTNTGGGDGGA